MDWARTAGERDGVNPVEGVENGLATQRDRVTHFNALPWPNVPALMRRLEKQEATGSLASQLLILTAARSGEVRGARWHEIDLDRALWTVPETRMKAGREHRVPLSLGALSILREAAKRRELSIDPVFPSPKSGRPLSDMTLGAVLKRFEVDVTVHGFRSTFRDWAEECALFQHEVKEVALAHTVRNKAEAAYRRTDLFEKKISLMEA